MCRPHLPLALVLGLVVTSAHSESLDHDWARIYNPPGSESALAIWAAPNGGVDILINQDGELGYIQYDAAGNLSKDRDTGIHTETFRFTQYASDGAGGFVVAANYDSVDSYGVACLRVSSDGGVLWRNLTHSTSHYPSAIKVVDGRLYVGAHYDYSTVYDPSLMVFDLDDGMPICDNLELGYYFKISDIDVDDGGHVFLVGYDNGGCDCFSWTRIFAPDCSLLKTNSYPGQSFAQFERLPSRNVLLTTSFGKVPFESSSFAVTWFHDYYDVPTAHLDSRDFMEGGCRADILGTSLDEIVIAGEHDVGGGNRELLIGTVGAGGLDVHLIRPNPSKSYDALQLATTSTYVVMLARETNFGGGSAARDVLLYDSDGSLLDLDVEGNMANPIGMVIGTDAGIYTVGGGALGIVLTKLIITGRPIGVPQTAPEAAKVSRLSLPAPNPATDFVRLDYETARDQTVTLEVYDPSGRLMKRLVEGRQNTGRHTVEWDIRSIPKGVYMVRFKAGNSYSARKIVVN